jgi:hypothetical protein
MNCVSIAMLPEGQKVTIKRIIEYFYPGDRGKIWVDIFVDNRASEPLTMRILHAGSLRAENVTEDSWVLERAEKDSCAVTLTKRIEELHEENYYPIKVERGSRSVWLDAEQYQAWQGSLERLIGDDGAVDVPFTLWEVKPIVPGKSVLRFRLEMNKSTYQRRLGEKKSFFAHGPTILLRNIEDADLPCYRGADKEKYLEAFGNFKSATKVPEAFEYLIVAPDDKLLSWDAVALSPMMSPRFIRSRRLARTTRWFATDVSFSDSWELASFFLKVDKTDEMQLAASAAAGSASHT